MNVQIRLAEREGRLTGPGLSSTQVRAVLYRDVETRLEYKTLLDQQAEQRFREALVPLVTSGMFTLDKLFPDAFAVRSSPSADREVVVDEDTVLPTPHDADETVVYQFDEVEMTPEEMERELMQLMHGGDVTVNGSDWTHGQ